MNPSPLHLIAAWRPSFSLLLFAGIAFLIVAWYALMFVVLLWETHPTQIYVPVDNTSRTPSASDPGVLEYRGDYTLHPYIQVNNELIAAARFIGPIIGRHQKGGTYRMMGAYWMSPQRDILVICGAGTMIKAQYRSTSLETRVGDRIWITRDEWGSADVSGIVDIQVVKNADFPELLAVHRARLAPFASIIRPYTKDGPTSYREDNDLRAGALERAGLAKFIDPPRTIWKCTLLGAVKGLFANMRWIRQATGGDLQENRRRQRMPRPGDANYQTVQFSE